MSIGLRKYSSQAIMSILTILVIRGYILAQTIADITAEDAECRVTNWVWTFVTNNSPVAIIIISHLQPTDTT